MPRLPTLLPLAGLLWVTAATAGAQPAPSVFTLADALARARELAPQVEAARARAGAAAAAVDAAGRWRAPTLDLSVENLGPQALDHDGFVWLTQPLDVGPRRTTRLRLARSQNDVLQRDVDAQRRLRDVQVVDAYLAVASRRQVVDILETHAASLDELVTYVRLRVDRGVSPEGDLRKLEAERARVVAARVRAALDMRQQVFTLSLLTREDAAGLEQRVQVPPMPTLPLPANIDTAPDRRPEVAVASAQLRERQSAAAFERAMGGTSLAVMGGYKRTAGFHTGTAGVSIDLPLGARNLPARLRAEAEVTAATLELERLREAVRLEMTAAVEAAQVLADQARNAQSTMVAPADVAVRAARAAFREGTGDVMALVDAERVHLDTRREAHALQIDAVAATLRARLALGDAPLP
ncbi:MAG TPA: TolC family protein [Luteitalea sp.]|nr:TolC family protein [Luteitalea sp.]